MDSTIKTYLALFLSGLIAGVIIMERWRITGRRLIPTLDSAGDAVETPTASTDSKVSSDKPKVSATLVAGAKADAQRVRDVVKRMTPGGTPPLDQLRRSSQAATPANTPNSPA